MDRGTLEKSAEVVVDLASTGVIGLGEVVQDVRHGSDILTDAWELKDVLSAINDVLVDLVGMCMCATSQWRVRALLEVSLLLIELVLLGLEVGTMSPDTLFLFA